MTDNNKAGTSGIPPYLRPWIIWGVGALFFGYSFFHRVTISAMGDDIMRDFGASGAVLGNLTAFYFYAYAGLQILVGVTVDRFGPRRVMTAAAILCAVGSLMFGLAPNMSVAYAGRLLIGAGGGFALIGTFKLGTVWFPPERFALITGSTASIGTIGAALGQAPLSLAAATFGWRTSMVSAAVVGVLIAVLIWSIARDNKGDELQPVLGSEQNKLSVMRGIGSVLANPHNWACSLILASMTVPLLAFAGLWGVPFLMEAYGVERHVAALSTSLFLIGHGIGSAGLGWVSDRIRRRKTPILVGGIVTTTAVLTVIYLPVPFIVAQGLMVIGGIASGATVINFAFTREHNRAEVAATSMGFVNLMNMGTSAIFQPLLGWFLDLTWDGTLVDGARIYSVEAFRSAFLAMVVVGVAGVVTAAIVRETYCRPLENREG